MVKFFRKIRRDSLVNSRVSKYLFYAVGEIMFLVIGILIALRVDTWNEQRKLKILEVKFLKSLKEDMVSDTLYFNRRIRDSEKVINDHYYFIHEAYREQKNVGEFKKLVNHIWWNSENFIAQNSTFKELLSAGRLNIFSNQELKEKVVALYNEYEVASSHIKEYNEVTGFALKSTQLTMFKYWKHYARSFDESYMFNKDEWAFINDPSSFKFRILEEVAATYSNKHEVIRDYFIDLKAKTKVLITDIEVEIKSRK